jgi:ElaB/YqjD/DUF883 family membrane-anchored ribosome-binding protein
MTNAHTNRRNGAEPFPVEEAFASVKEGLAEVGGTVNDLTSALGAEIAERAHDFSAAAEKRARSTIETVTKQVRQHPQTTLGIAAGAGFVLGLLMASRHR